jgi:hypothetical protein
VTTGDWTLVEARRLFDMLGDRPIHLPAARQVMTDASSTRSW